MSRLRSTQTSGRRASLLALAVVAGFATGPIVLRAQRPTERPVPLTVDFVALDADGAPVADLQSSEVEIRIGDRVRAVRSLSRVSAAAAPAAAGSAPRPPSPYATNDDVAAGRRFVLLVDQESFQAGREPLYRNAVEGLIGQLTPADRIMVAALPFGGVIQPFTASPASVRAAMTRVTGQGARSETGSDLACRTRRFLESLEGLLRNAGARTAPVTFVLFTSGMAAPRRDAPMGLMPGMCELVVDQFRKVGTVAGAARANFYVLHPADMATGGGLSRANIGGIGDLGSDNPLEGIEHLAGVTGATRLSLDAAGTASLLRVAKESSAYYVAELEPVRDEVFGRTRPLQVRVARRGVVVRARPEITLVEPPSTAAARQSLNDLLVSADAFTDLRLRAGGFSVRDADGGLRVGVLTEVVNQATPLSSLGAVLFDGDGRVAGRWTARDPSERPLLGAFAVPPGAYRLRVVAIDQEGRQGAAEGSIDAGFTQVGPLSLGSLMLGVSRGGTTTLQLEFGAEPTAIASFDIYGGAAGLRLSATLDIARTLDGPAIAAVPLVLTRVDDTRVTAAGTVPVGALPAGDYAIRATVRLDDGATGRVTRTLRKVTR